MEGALLARVSDSPSPAGDVPATSFGLHAVDLFCGAGGLSYAFHRADFRIVAAVEMDKNAAASYRRSFIDKHSPTK
jgi:tRNA/tmRNA/rRNA uracil-C5-methylase (TrmA/RlmC/RlmD family)